MGLALTLLGGLQAQLAIDYKVTVKTLYFEGDSDDGALGGGPDPRWRFSAKDNLSGGVWTADFNYSADDVSVPFYLTINSGDGVEIFSRTASAATYFDVRFKGWEEDDTSGDDGETGYRPKLPSHEIRDQDNYGTTSLGYTLEVVDGVLYRYAMSYEIWWKYAERCGAATNMAVDVSIPDRARVTWTHGTHAQAYDVYRAYVNDFSQATLIDSENQGTHYTDFDVQSGQTVYYWVRGYRYEWGGSHNAALKTDTLSDVSAPASGFLKLTQYHAPSSTISKVYGDAPFEMGVTSNPAERTPTITSLNPEIATVDGTTITIHRAGNVSFRFEEAGDSVYFAYNSVFTNTLTVSPAALTLQMSENSKIVGNSDPPLAYDLTGLVAGDTYSGYLGREAGETPGSYATNIGTWSPDNPGGYTVTFIGEPFVIKSGPVVSIAATTNAAEPATDGAFTLTLNEAAAVELTVSLSTAGTATPGVDYTVPSSVIIPHGDLEVVVPVTILNDSLYDGEESIELSIVGDSTDYAPDLVNHTASITITDNEAAGPLFTVSAADQLINALNISAADAAYNSITFAGDIVMGATDVLPDVDVTDGQQVLIDGAGYALSGAGTRPGLKFSGGNLYLEDLTLRDFLLISGPSSTVYGGALSLSGTTQLVLDGCTLLDNRTEGLTMMTMPGGSAYGGAAAVLENASLEFKGDNAFDSNTAQRGEDITINGVGKGGGLYVAPTASAALAHDASLTFTNNAASDSGSAGNDWAPFVEEDNDALLGKVTIIPQVSIGAVRDAAEPATNGAYIIQIDPVLTVDHTVYLSVTGTATGGVDYEAIANNVVIQAGFNGAQLPVTVLNDSSYEGEESVEVALTDDPSYTLSPGAESVRLTISDNETPGPIFSVSSPDQLVNALNIAATDGFFNSITLENSITLADPDLLPEVDGSDPAQIYIDGAGHTLSGAGVKTGLRFRGGNAFIANLTFSNFLLISGPSSAAYGSALYADGSAVVTLNNCTFTGNRTEGLSSEIMDPGSAYGGAAAFLDASTLVMQENTLFDSNTAQKGVGLTGITESKGGALYVAPSANATLVAGGSLTFVDNSASDAAEPGNVWMPLVDVDNDALFGKVNVQRIHVDASASGENSGVSWADALTSLHDAFEIAPAYTEIWVAKGMYNPILRSDIAEVPASRSDTFELPDRVTIYGSFPSGGGALEDRDPITHLTILSGDIDEDDPSNGQGLLLSVDGSTKDSDNSYHVVTALNISATTLDGFVVTGGVADGVSADGLGGGLYVENSNVTIKDVSFYGNYAGGAGGAVCNTTSSAPMFDGCYFGGNSAGAGSGGAMANVSDAGPTLQSSSFIGNAAAHGGALSNADTVTVTVQDSTFFDNQASLDGGAIHHASGNILALHSSRLQGNQATGHGGGLHLGGGINSQSCLFAGNLAASGGGVYVLSGAGDFANATVASNKASADGGGFHFAGAATINLYNLIIWNNEDVSGLGTQNANAYLSGGAIPMFESTTIQGGVPPLAMDLADNSALDPLLRNALGPDQSPTVSGDYRLHGNSPAIDTGSNNWVTHYTDVTGSARLSDGDADSITTVDRGAYEIDQSILDDDGDGMPNDYEQQHTPERSTTSLMPSSNDDQDAYTALQEYAYGLNPFVADGAQAVVWQLIDVDDTQYLSLIYPVNLDALPFLQFKVERSTDLSSWGVGDSTVVGENYPGGTVKYVTERSNLPMGSESKEFLRLNVSPKAEGP